MEWRRFEGEEKPLEPFQLETPSLGSDRASRSRALTPAAFTPAAVHAESWEPYSSLLVGRSISAAIEAEVAEIDALTVEEVEEQVRGKHLTNAQTHPLVVDAPVFLDLSELADEISDAKAQALTEAEAAARAKLSKEEAEINAAIAAVDAAVAREDAEAAAAVCAVEAHLARGGGGGGRITPPQGQDTPPQKELASGERLLQASLPEHGYARHLLQDGACAPAGHPGALPRAVAPGGVYASAEGVLAFR